MLTNLTISKRLGSVRSRPPRRFQLSKGGLNECGFPLRRRTLEPAKFTHIHSAQTLEGIGDTVQHLKAPKDSPAGSRDFYFESHSDSTP